MSGRFVIKCGCDYETKNATQWFKQDNWTSDITKAYVWRTIECASKQSDDYNTRLGIITRVVDVDHILRSSTAYWNVGSPIWEHYRKLFGLTNEEAIKRWGK